LADEPGKLTKLMAIIEAAADGRPVDGSGLLTSAQ
jgi:hypothetical protein